MHYPHPRKRYVILTAGDGTTIPPMNAPMVGSWVVDVQAVQPFTIHGDLYYELHVTRRDDAAGGQVLALKVPAHAIPARRRRGRR